MDKSIGDNTKKKRGRKVTTGIGTLIGVRLLPLNLSALDAWISCQPEPRPTRPEAIRKLVEKGLGNEVVGEKSSRPSDVSLDMQIAEQEVAIAEMPELAGPSPEAALATMDKALAENDLVKLKNKRVRRKVARRT
jgi:hypothetical protein